MVQGFYVEPNPEEIIIAVSFLIVPDIKNASSGISASILNGRKNKSKKNESSSLTSTAALSTKTLGICLNEQKNKEKKNYKIK